MTDDKPDVFDAGRLRELVDPLVRRTLLSPGALEGIVRVLHAADLFRMTLGRLGMPAEMIERATRTVPTVAEAVAEIRTFLEASPSEPADLTGTAVIESCE
jgi:hypothetical protein